MAIVVDPHYAEGIIELARECHVWVVRSDSNDPVVAALREDGTALSLDEGVSTFNPGETPEASFLSILDVVEEHHGEYSHDPPLSVIELIGSEPSAVVRDELDSYGFRDVESSPTGFVARRDSA